MSSWKMSHEDSVTQAFQTAQPTMLTVPVLQMISICRNLLSASQCAQGAVRSTHIKHLARIRIVVRGVY
jgi:hypothetical protein